MASMHTEDLALFALPPMNTAEVNKNMGRISTYL